MKSKTKSQNRSRPTAPAPPGAAGSAASASGGVPSLRFGRMFVGPIFDGLLIGGGLSLISALAIWLASGRTSVDRWAMPLIPTIFLFSNSAHFAASTVRLYTKPGAFRTLPKLTMLFPLVALALTTLGLQFYEGLGAALFRLYVTWSPFHYSSQAYGLAVMYCYRAGVHLPLREKRWLYAGCLMTFMITFVEALDARAGIWMILPPESIIADPGKLAAVYAVSRAFGALAYALPLGLFLWMWLRRRTPMPLISLLVVMSNCVWFTCFRFLDAVTWTTVFHGLQYLAIVGIFHVKDHTAAVGNRRGWFYHAAMFYAACVPLGYGLINLWPMAYQWMGFGSTESQLIVLATINLHHFIVDGYIWKLRKDPNYRVVTEALPV